MTYLAALNDPALIFLCGVLLAMAIGLWASNWQIRCVRCNRNCAGRCAGGTIDAPLCVDCAAQERKR